LVLVIFHVTKVTNPFTERWYWWDFTIYNWACELHRQEFNRLNTNWQEETKKKPFCYLGLTFLLFI